MTHKDGLCHTVVFVVCAALDLAAREPHDQSLHFRFCTKSKQTELQTSLHVYRSVARAWS
jgi:hypothetical protein